MQWGDSEVVVRGFTDSRDSGRTYACPKSEKPLEELFGIKAGKKENHVVRA